MDILVSILATLFIVVGLLVYSQESHYGGLAIVAVTVVVAGTLAFRVKS